MNTARQIIIGASAIFLAACVTVTDPVQVGDNRYLVTLNARGGFQSDGQLLTQSIQKANSYCEAQGKRAEVEKTEVSGVQMWTPQNNQVFFSCR